MNDQNSTWTTSLLLSLGCFAIAILGGVAKLLHDVPDSNVRITRRDWFRYISCSILAGAILGFVVYTYYGPSPLLFAVSGTAGFGSVQILGLAVEILKTIVGKLFNTGGNTGGDNNRTNKNDVEKS